MAINLTTDLNVTTGGKLTDIGQIQGGWKTVATKSEMNALTASGTLKGKLQNGQMFYVSSSAELYTCKIVGSGPFAVYSFNQFVWPGTETTELNTFTGSIQAQVDNITSVTGSFSTTSSVNSLSSSIASDITALQFFSSSLDLTFATDTQVNAATASLSSSLASSIATNLNLINSNSSSFASSITGNLNLINSNSSSFASEISALQSFSASLDATFATDTEVQQAVSFLNANTGSYATTGSNLFIGNQTVNGILILTTQSITPSFISGGLYLDQNYNLYIGGN